ncbi:DUF3017 domain-containing protein [Pseudofrankia inefficax]|uniref:DUF3017 domain-containing protein n=1 Tax=Pseudofrankia inefficax (strain DSM 45817 / CECT 9037 / DDB 130130 / EuI1c) TaxID=298654 RepID=UPI0002F2F221|nr:DUF3017 domain-containing protein [Pseudofrankia inefficax]
MGLPRPGAVTTAGEGRSGYNEPPPVGARAGSRARAKAQRAAERRRGGPWFVREFALTAALAGVVVGMILVVAQNRWRVGLFGIGTVLLVLAAARLVLPAHRMGLLAVRGRLFDTVLLTVLGAAVIGLTLTVPLPIAVA